MSDISTPDPHVCGSPLTTPASFRSSSRLAQLSAGAAWIDRLPVQSPLHLSPGPVDFRISQVFKTKRTVEKKKKSSPLKDDVKKELQTWLLNNWEHPYPTADDKAAMCKKYLITKKRLENWFTNNRARVWKPTKIKSQNKTPDKSDK